MSRNSLNVARSDDSIWAEVDRLPDEALRLGRKLLAVARSRRAVTPLARELLTRGEHDGYAAVRTICFLGYRFV